jgi:hypothetical protein
MENKGSKQVEKISEYYESLENTIVSDIQLECTNGYFKKVEIRITPTYCTQSIKVPENCTSLSFKIHDINDFPLFLFRWHPVRLYMELTDGAIHKTIINGRDPTPQEQDEYYKQKCVYYLYYYDECYKKFYKACLIDGLIGYPLVEDEDTNIPFKTPDKPCIFKEKRI